MGAATEPRRDIRIELTFNTSVKVPKNVDTANLIGGSLQLFVQKTANLKKHVAIRHEFSTLGKVKSQEILRFL